MNAARILPVLVLALSSAPLSAQVQAPELWLMAHGDSVTAQLPRVPDTYEGFHLYRASAGTEFVRLTEEPVQPVRDPNLFLDVLGPDRSVLQDRTRSATEAEMGRRLRANPVVASLYSYLFPSVALALGRRYTDPGVVAGETYSYRAVLIDEAGQETDQIREASVTVADVLPRTPAALSVEPLNNQVALQWDYPDYTGDPQDLVVGFHVYRAGDGDDTYVRRTTSPLTRDDTADPTWDDLAVVNGRTYRYRVRAVDLLGREGPPSEPATVAPQDPDPPAAPRSVRTFPGESLVQVAWRVSPEPDVEGYRVERSSGLDQRWDTLTTELIPAQDPAWTDSTAAGGTQLFYRVVAIDIAGRESRPSNAVSATAFDTRPPGPPVSLSVSLTNRAASLDWTPPGDRDVAGYHVYRSGDDDVFVRLTPGIVEATQFLDAGPETAGLNPGGRYRMRVTALDSLGNESEPADVTVVVPDDQAPEPPSSLDVVNPTGREAEVRWNASPSLDVVRYVLTRRPSGAAESPPARVDTVAVGGRRLLRQSELETGREYRFVLVAVDSAGNESEPIGADFLFRDAAPPPAPAFVQAAAQGGGVVVAWERVVADDLAGYRVLRSDLPTGRYEVVSDLLSSTGERRFVDPEGTEGLFYRVEAEDVSGNTAESDPVRAGGGS